IWHHGHRQICSTVDFGKPSCPNACSSPPTMWCMAQTFDVCIRGAGIVGRTLALLLARERLRVALVDAPRSTPAQTDVRAYALNANSKQLLESLRTWPDALHATTVKHMEVH